VDYFRWRHQQWEPISEGLPAQRLYSNAQVVLADGGGPALYTCLALPGTAATRTFRWRQGSWSEMSAEFWQWDSAAGWLPMASVDFGGGPHIYGKLPYGRITRWNGAAWEQVGQATNNTNIDSMIGYNDGRGMALYLFGQFQFVDGVSAHQFAKWDGQTWTGPWPNGQAGYAGRPSVAVYDDGLGPKLYCNYAFAYNGVNRNGLHRWDGTQWEFLGGPTSGNGSGYIVFDDGTGAGPGLYIGGTFTIFGGVPAPSLVRYDGRGFHVVPGGEAWGNPLPIGVIRDERGEGLAMWGGYPNQNCPNPPCIMRTIGVLYGCHLPTCPAECDANGRLDVNDFVCFLTAFVARRPYANAFPDGAFDVQDFNAFLARFAAGCP
jgi:hypothetical protein